MNRTELGAALKGWRGRIDAAEVGLPAGTRRRTAGLRREEVAQLAGISVDYVARLEQGRGPHPSESVLTALARALRLSGAEHAHLCHLADVAPPRTGQIVDIVRPSVLRLMNRFTDLPALVVNARTDVLAWNAMAAALQGDHSAVPAPQRNLSWQQFVDPGSSRLLADGDERSRLEHHAVADLRSACARYPDDARLQRLVGALRKRSPAFEQLWQQRPVHQRRVDRKRYRHPQLGVLELDCDALQVPDDDQILIVYSATPGSSDAQALALLRVIGVHSSSGDR